MAPSEPGTDHEMDASDHNRLTPSERYQRFAERNAEWDRRVKKTIAAIEKARALASSRRSAKR